MTHPNCTHLSLLLGRPTLSYVPPGLVIYLTEIDAAHTHLRSVCDAYGVPWDDAWAELKRRGEVLRSTALAMHYPDVVYELARQIQFRGWPPAKEALS